MKLHLFVQAATLADDTRTNRRKAAPGSLLKNQDLSVMDQAGVGNIGLSSVNLLDRECIQGMMFMSSNANCAKNN